MKERKNIVLNPKRSPAQASAQRTETAPLTCLVCKFATEPRSPVPANHVRVVDGVQAKSCGLHLVASGKRGISPILPAQSLHGQSLPPRIRPLH